MSFNQIVWKMAKVDYRKYLLYFFCNSFAVMFFFMFSTVFFNEQIIDVKKEAGLDDAFKIPIVALVVFSVFFIGYAHSIFMKKRRSELGLFMTLGMSNRDISKLVLLENGIIGLLSILTGLIAGLVFSRLFFIIILEISGFKGVPFQINSTMFWSSIVAYCLVFFIVVGLSRMNILNGDIIQSLKNEKVKETQALKSPLLGGIGLVFIMGSILGQYYSSLTAKDPGAHLLWWASFTFVGVYISLNQFTSLFIEFAKMNKSFYFKRLLFLTSLDYKLKKLISILMLVTVMIMVTIFYSTINLLTYKYNEKAALGRNPYDIAFLQTETKNNLPKNELYSIVDQKGHRVQKHLDISLYYFTKGEGDTDSANVLMPADDFNKLTKQKVNLQDKEYIYYLNNSDDGLEVDFPLPASEMKNNYTMKEVMQGQNINFWNLYEYIVVSNEEYERLKKTIEGFEATYQLFKVANWKKTAHAVEQLETRLESYNEKTPPFDGAKGGIYSEPTFYEVSSKIGDVSRIKQTDGLFFFAMSFIGVIFFFGSIVLLYLNLFADIETEKAKFRKLSKMGITVKEVKRIIASEVTTVFFVPNIIGTTLAFLYIVVMAAEDGGVSQNPEILVYFLSIAGIYLFIQGGFYLYARRKMFDQLMG